MLWWIVGVVAAMAVLILLAALGCFLLACYSKPRKPVGEDEYPLPQGAIYEPHHPQFREWMRDIRRMPHEEVTITSYDGLTLRGTYYEYRKGAPLEILFPGYRGTALRDLCGGVQRCFDIGHNALLVDQRGGGRSDGRVITFGIRERRDCAAWAAYAANRFGEDQPIILTGISMGAATVMMATALPLPNTVVGVLADCGYTSPKAIICKVIRQLRLPVWPLYRLIRLGMRLYGGFDPEEASPLEAMRECRLPMVFIHGEADDYVPFSMSEENYKACAAQKTLLSVPDAGHGLAYPAAPDAYIRAMAQVLPCRIQNT